MNLVLCGMMGSGKTTVGIKIADLTARRWYDTDSLIENSHGKISDIFEKHGETQFRKWETEVVEALSQQDNLVISTGGGLVLKQENIPLLQKKGKIVFLRASLETLEERLKANKDRPLLQTSTENLREKLARLMQERAPVYERVADYMIDVDGKTAEEIAREIIAAIGIDL